MARDEKDQRETEGKGKKAQKNVIILLGLNLKVPQYDSHVSLKLIQEIPNVVLDGNTPLELLPVTRSPVGLQDTVQLCD